MFAILIVISYFTQPSSAQCPAGTYFLTSTSLCTSCPAGTYIERHGSTACTSCAFGYYSVGGASWCATCNVGTFSPPASTTCLSFDVGIGATVSNEEELKAAVQIPGNIVNIGCDIYLTSSLIIEAISTKIYGNGYSLNGQNYVRVLYINTDSVVEINGLTITNGYAQQGAGIYNLGTLTLTNSFACSNAAGSTSGVVWGGAIDNLGALYMVGCILTDNTVTAGSGQGGWGGGIVNFGALTLTSCYVTWNTANYGGGLYNEGTLLMSNCYITNNSGYGGGISNLGDELGHFQLRFRCEWN